MARAIFGQAPSLRLGRGELVALLHRLGLAVQEVVQRDDVLPAPRLTSLVPAARGASPRVMTTRAMTGRSNCTPTRLDASGARRVGTTTLAIRWPSLSNASRRVVLGRSTSTTTAPKLCTTAAVFEPGMRNWNSARLVPIGANSLGLVKGISSVA